MANLLYTLGKIDPRVHPLVNFMVLWTENRKLKAIFNPNGPSDGFRKFTLTYMVIFYLQFGPKILPSVSKLANLASKKS